MSNSEKRPYAAMRAFADRLVAKLAPACERIEIAGSLRRQCEFVSDIELVAIPKCIPNLLGEPTTVTEVDLLLATLPVTLVKNGPKQKQFTFDDAYGRLVQVDLFLQPDPATWGVNYLIRTGNAAFSHRMVTPRLHGGYKPNQYQIKDARVWHNGTAIDTQEEEAVFELWAMSYIEPQDRK